uniref:28 kDa Metastriate family member n=1 Tax=Rhipicephalus appendiculatus TaxID=34631 RepID=A0A131YY09_RHIAP
MRTFCSITLLAILQYMVFAVAEGQQTNTIGDGVVVNASIFFDNRYYNASVTRKVDVTNDLRNVVKLAQEYLLTKSIKVNFSVLTVQNRSDYLELYENNTINGQVTLQKMTKLAESLQAPNNSIYYHFAGYVIYGKLDQLDWNPYGVSDIATNGTFCHSPSAAIIQYFPGSSNIRAFVSATAHIFGAKGRTHFDTEDIKTMNETFAKCK